MNSFSEKAEAIFANFSDLQSFSERMQVFLNCQEITAFVRENLTIGGRKEKDGGRSDQWRIQGNIHFKNRKDDLALQQYNNAVKYGSTEDNSLSLALANRSAVLLRRTEYKMTIQDIDMSLEVGYPKHLVYKILERRARAYILTGDREKAMQDVKTAESMVQEAGLDEGKKRAFLETLTCLKPETCPSTEKVHPPHSGNLTPASLLKPNPKFPGLGDMVELRSSPTAGRFMVVNRNIQVGEILGTESPVCSVLLRDQQGVRCDNCVQDCALAPVPCLGCVAVAYCSLDCRNSSKHSHDLECCVQENISTHLLENKVLESFPDYFRLGFRILAQARDVDSQDTLARFLEQSCVDFSAPVDQREGDLASLLNLCGWDTKPNLEKDFWVYVIIVLYLEILERKGFYETCAKKLYPLSLAEMLYRIIKILQYNCHSVLQCVLQGEQVSMQPIGSAIYTSMAFLNHSCDPNTIKYFEGDRVVLVASRPIPAGDQLTDNYGPHFSLSHRVARHTWLKEYHGFICSCTACVRDFPLFENLPDRVRNLVCPCGRRVEDPTPHPGGKGGPTPHPGGKGGPTPHPGGKGGWRCPCGEEISEAALAYSVKQARLKLMETSKMELMSGVTERSECEYKECISTLYSSMRHPFNLLLVAERLYWRTLRMRYGNRRIIK